MARIFAAGKLSRRAAETQAALRRLDADLGAMDIPEMEFRKLVEEAARWLRPRVIGALLQSYESSGIGKDIKRVHSGWIKSAIRNASMVPTRSGLRIRFPSALSPVDGKSNPYMVGASLLYGSVRGVRAGEQAKRTIKGAVLSGKALSKRAKAAHKKFKINAGAAVVTPPWPFFVLNPAQQAELVALFRGRMAEMIRLRRRAS